MTFDDVYRRHLPAVLRAASRAVGRRDVAEEITADAFLELHRQFDRIEQERLPGWLITVVRNRAIDYWRRQQLERLFVEQAAEPVVAPETPEAAGAAQDLFAHPSLKPVHRTCLSLRYEHELSREQIAARLGRPRRRRGHLQYGLTLLRQHAGDRHDGRTARASPARVSDPAVVLALEEGVLDETVALRVRARECPACQRAAADLAQVFDEPVPAESNSASTVDRRGPSRYDSKRAVVVAGSGRACGRDRGDVDDYDQPVGGIDAGSSDRRAESRVCAATGAQRLVVDRRSAGDVS
jgi:RNA polymerase sigma-70 factor (ECF subfamily)